MPDPDIAPRQMTPEQAARLNLRIQAQAELNNDIAGAPEDMTRDEVMLTDIAISLRMIISALPVEQQRIVTP